MLKKILKETVFLFINWFNPAVKNKASVLMYHSIGYEGAFFSVRPEIFEEQIKYIKENGYKVVKISTFFDLLKTGADLSKILAITFDDGYKDNFLNAFPVLQKYNIPVSIFLATNFIGKSMSTSDSFSLDILNNEEIEIMSSSGLVEFLPHSMSHRIFNSISTNEAIGEAEGSFEVVKRLNKFCSKIFAYPKGKFTSEIVEYFKKNDWLGAVSVFEGAVSPKDDFFSLKRNSVDSQTSFNQFKAKISGKVQYYVSLKNFLLGGENKKKPKIVFAINDFTTAGAQRLYVDLLKHLKSDYDIYLFTLFQFDVQKDFYDLVLDEKIKVFKFGRERVGKRIYQRFLASPCIKSQKNPRKY
jgi:peptidoglycan/xylan/chitin deacetylase (PgdA/CDA1 family)